MEVAVQASNANATAGALAGAERKFAGSWEWLGCASEGQRLVLSHLRSQASSTAPVVLGMSEYELPEPAALLDARGLFAFLRTTDLVRRAPRKPIALVLGQTQYEVLLVNEPDLREASDEQRREAARWALQDLVNFPVEDASVDIIAGASPGGARQILVVAAGTEVIAPLVREAALLRVALAAVDVRETVQRNIAHLFEEPGRLLGFITVVGHQALFTLSADGELLMTRRIDAVRETESLERAILEDERVLDRIGLEVLRTLDNFERQSGRSELPRLLLGCGPHTGPLTHHLRSLLGFHVEPVVPERIAPLLHLAPDLQTPVQAWNGLHLLALGAALRGEARS